jgi:hypothetical protein
MPEAAAAAGRGTAVPKAVRPCRRTPVATRSSTGRAAHPAHPSSRACARRAASSPRPGRASCASKTRTPTASSRPTWRSCPAVTSTSSWSRPARTPPSSGCSIRTTRRSRTTAAAIPTASSSTPARSCPSASPTPTARRARRAKSAGSTTAWTRARPASARPVSTATPPAADGMGGRNSVINVCGGAAADLRRRHAFDWRDTVMYFAMIDRFADGDGRRPRARRDRRRRAHAGRAGSTKAATSRASPRSACPTSPTSASRRCGSRRPTRTATPPAPRSTPGADPHTYSAYHGYWPSPDNIDYADPAPPPRPRVEPRIGTDTDLRALVSAAHGPPAPTATGSRALRLRDEARRLRERALPRAQRLVRARTTGASASAAPRTSGTTRLGHPLRVHQLPRPVRLRQPRRPRLERQRRRVVGPSTASTATASTPSSTCRCRGSPTCAPRSTREFDPRWAGASTWSARPSTTTTATRCGRFVEPPTMLDGQFDFPFKARLCEALFTPGGRLDTFANWMPATTPSTGQGRS